MERFDLYLRLIRKLSSGSKYNKQSIIEDFDITDRKFDRYIHELRDLGFEIPRAKEGYYWIDRKLSRTELADLVYINDEELTILAQAIEVIDEGNALKSELRRKMRALLDPSLITNSILHPERAKIVKNIGIAIEKQQQIIIHQYRSSNSREIRDRKVEPISLSSNFQMLCAFDIEDRIPKHYKISRMESISILEKPFQYTEQHTNLKSDAFRMSGITSHNICFQMTLTAYNLLKEEYPMSGAHTRKISDGLWEFSGPVYSNQGVGRFIMSLPGHIRVIEDKTLKAHIDKSGKNLGRIV